MEQKKVVNCLKITFSAICILMLINVQAQKKVTYGKSTFTLYRPLPNLVPTPVCGFAPEVPGYTLKSKNYGPGTYYCYAPGNVPKTNYKCILTEIRDWVGYRPDVVKELAAKKGLVPMEEKAIKKMFKNLRLSYGDLMYQLTETSWMCFYVKELQNCGAKALESHEEYVLGVSFIEKVPQQTEVVLDRLYRFWNDGVIFTDYASVNQLNFNTKPSAPTDQNPNNFAISDVLNPKKGFYRLAFNGGAPTYVWHSYEKVVEENLKKSNFDAKGTAGYNDLLTAFDYGLNAVNTGQNVYFSYSVNSRFLRDIEPGRTWQKEMAGRKENDARMKVEMQKINIANGAALEKMYKEIFK
jgi:hypothetical protein